MSSRSGGFQSKILRYAIRQTQQFATQAAIALRRLQVTATWGAQILLYPIYAVVQTVRILRAEVQQAMKLASSDQANLDWVDSEASPTATREIVTTETPIQQALLTVAQFSFSEKLLIRRRQSPPEVLGILAQPELAQDLNPLVISQPATIVTADSTMLESLSQESQPAIAGAAIVSIQGIASLIATRSLVLVTHQNEILDILTAAQQTELRQTIIWAVASYGRSRYLEQRLPALLRPSQALVKVSRQLQTKTQQFIRLVWFLLIVLGRTGRRVASRLGQSEATREMAVVPAIATLPGTVTRSIDLPIQQALQMVAQFALPESAVVKLLPAEAGQLTIASPDDPTKINAETSSLQSIAPLQRSPKAAIVIRGIACCLETRSLVLVTQQNQVLDILTATQQTQLQHRITWDVANFGREQKLSQASHSTSLPFQPDTNQKMLSPVLALQHLMVWMQQSSVAIALNLFQEAALVPAIVEFKCEVDLDFFPLSPPQTSQQDAALVTVPTSATIAQFESSDRSNTSSTDYIETSVTLLSYEQSLIEKLLHWLDRCLVWLEDWVARLWHRAN
jgi:hypothetical protein